MKKSTLAPFVLLVLFLFFSDGKPQKQKSNFTDKYWPTESWRTSTPEQQGMDSGELIKIFKLIQENEVNIHSILIIRNGYMVLDAYFYPFSQGTVHNLASVTKSITSVVVGIAIDKGYIKSIEQQVLDFFPDRTIANLDENKKRLNLENLLTMTTGFCRDFNEGEAQLSQMCLSGNWVQFMLDLPLVIEPSGEFAYCSGGCQLLSAIITQTTGMTALDLAREYLFQPLGIHDVIWPADPQGNNTGWGDLFMHPRDLAKIGYLLLNKGRWEDKQIISSEWVKLSTHQQIALPDGQGYGYLWWIPNELSGLYEARGRGGQLIAVWPDKNLVVVLTGSGYEPGEVGAYIVSAIRSDRFLAENHEGFVELNEKIEAAAKPPVPEPTPTLPQTARRISGKTYVFEPNSLGLRSFSLSFDNETEALLKQDIDGEMLKARIGLDGVYRISNSSRFGLPAALKGFWATENEFVLIFNEAANNFLYRTRVQFVDDRAFCRIDENTGLVDTTLVAKVLK